MHFYSIESNFLDVFLKTKDREINKPPMKAITPSVSSADAIPYTSATPPVNSNNGILNAEVILGIKEYREFRYSEGIKSIKILL